MSKKDEMKVSVRDLSFMLANLDLPEDFKQKLQGSMLAISSDDADALRDYCSNKLDLCGFDKNYEPTEVGRKFEELIDKLFTG